MRFSNVILVYFIVGAVMWGGGAINWENSGLSTVIVNSPSDGVDTNDRTAEELGNATGPIQKTAQTFGGPLLAIWDLISKLIGFLFWPIIALESNNAPPKITVLLGGSVTMAFYGGVLRLIRTSG